MRGNIDELDLLVLQPLALRLVLQRERPPFELPGGQLGNVDEQRALHRRLDVQLELGVLQFARCGVMQHLQHVTERLDIRERPADDRLGGHLEKAQEYRVCLLDDQILIKGGKSVGRARKDCIEQLVG